MAKLTTSELEKEQQTFIGFRKDVQLGTDMTRRQIKEARGREGLQERSTRVRTSTQRQHEINKYRKKLLQKLMNDSKQEQEQVLVEEFERNL